MHLGGWYVVAYGNELLGLISIDSLTWADGVSSFISTSIACIFTHFYRLILLKIKHFEKINYTRFFFGFFFGAIFLANTVTLCDTWIEWWVFKIDYFNWVDFASLALNVGRYIVMWLLFYYFFKIGLTQMQVTQTALDAERKLVTLQSEAYQLKLSTEHLAMLFPIIYQTMDKNPKQARQLITALSELLRNALNYEKKTKIALTQEIQLIQKYWEIAQLNFEEAPELTIHANALNPTLQILANSLLVVIVFVLKVTNQTEKSRVNLIYKNENTLFIEFESSKDVNLMFLNDLSIQNLQAQLMYLSPNKEAVSLQKIAKQYFQICLPVFINSSTP